MKIEWDPNKAKSNVAKHGIHFSDVEAAFYDPYAIVVPDHDAEGEDKVCSPGCGRHRQNCNGRIYLSRRRRQANLCSIRHEARAKIL